MAKKRPDVKDILKKYEGKLSSKKRDFDKSFSRGYSSDYVKFKNELSHSYSRYEKWCHSLGNVIKLNISEKDRKRIQGWIDIAHLDIQPWQSMTLSVMAFFSVFILGLLISAGVVLINSTNGLALESFPIMFFVLVVIFSLFLFYYVNNIPKRLANKWRLKASSQMIPAILYVVVYMRHTSNLEKAISFAAENLDYPLALDFKKVFYDVQIGKFSTIKESLDGYLKTWRDYSSSFVEAFHLIESSLFETNDSRRISTLEKGLKVALDGIYDKMLKFSHNVRSPLTNVYMLGVVLPTLAIALLPLASAMVGGAIKIVHVFVLFNLIIPFFVFYMTDKILMMRPGGYGETSLLERNPYYPEYKSKKPYVTAFFICLPFFILGFLPLIFQFTSLPELIGLSKDFTFSEIGLDFLGQSEFFDFEEKSEGVKGPYGFGALILSLFLPLGLGLFFSTAFVSKTKNLIKQREQTKRLEDEFNNSLFQLGNRIGGGVPPELVFGKVAESSKGLATENFFRRVNHNIRQMGMSVEKAIFDSRRGAINYFPSDLIATSMKILVESTKKGLKAAATSLMSISEYVKNIKKINHRLRDLLAEIISDMKSNMTFLAPLLTGIVVGLATMIVAILDKIQIPSMEQGGVASVSTMDQILGMFVKTQTIPPYYLQIAIGLYLIQIIFILTSTLVTINSGNDPLKKTNDTAKNLKKGILFYFVVSFIATLALFVLSTLVIGNSL